MKYPEVHPGVKGLIFDLDGTLADSIPVHIEAWNETCKTFDFYFPVEAMMSMTGRPVSAFAQYIREHSSCKLSEEEVLRLMQNNFHRLVHSIKPIEKVAALVNQYHGKMPMSIGTGGTRHNTYLILKAIGMLEYFDIIVSAEDVTKHKPEPDTFLRCAELMGISPEFCQVFEDGELGLKAAVEAGMKVTDVKAYY